MTEVKASKAKAQRRSPELDRFLRETRGAVVPLAAKCLLALEKSDGDVAIDKSQVYNLKAACAACEDPREVEVWVLYQMGRLKESGKGWRSRGTGENAGGEEFGQRILGCFAKHETPLRQWVANSELSTAPDVTNYLIMELLRSLAGQLARLHAYAEKTTDWGTIGAIAEGEEQ